jgi:ketosteroid isomerase-like protein
MRSIAIALACFALLLVRPFSSSEDVASLAQAPEGGGQSGTLVSSDESEIREVMNEQAADWNRGDIDAFMTSYWKSEETLFVGASGVARGWQAVLDRYHRTYPDRKAMGQVRFSNLEVHKLCSNAALVVGNYHLDRENDHPEGVFTLDFRKLPEGWRIIVDHTTAFPAEQKMSPQK